MKPNYLFIVGMAKSGSTALANWMVMQGLADYAVAGNKEPYSYAEVGHRHLPPPGTKPLLDASVGYIRNPGALAKLPEHRTRIVVCLRNPLERAWSEYKMYRISALQNEAAGKLWQDFHLPGQNVHAAHEAHFGHSMLKEFFLQHYRRKVAHMVEKHFDAESRRIATGTFATRIEYEMAFFMSNQEYPFLSCLGSSFCFRGIKILLKKYQPQDVVLLSLPMLNEPSHRARFVERLIGTAGEYPPVPHQFSSKGLDCEEDEPDFHGAEWQQLRRLFSHDLTRLKILLDEQAVDQSLMDWQALSRHMNLG